MGHERILLEGFISANKIFILEENQSLIARTDRVLKRLPNHDLNPQSKFSCRVQNKRKYFEL